MPREPGKYQKERGELQRRKIVALLESGPHSAQDIARGVHLTRGAVLLHIRQMREAGQVRIASHVMQYRSREIPLYGLGDAPDAEYVRSKDRLAPNSFDVQREKVRQMILNQLKIARATAPELAILLGLANPTMRKYLPMMREENLIHRAAWAKKDGGGIQVAIWAVGNKPDAPKDKVIPRTTVGSLPQDQMDLLWKKKEVKKILSAAKKKPQGIFAALGI